MQSAAAGKVRDLIQAEEIPATPGTCLSEEVHRERAILD